MELCGSCKKRPAKHQLYIWRADGTPARGRKLCDQCRELFARNMQPSKNAKPGHLWCVMVGKTEVRTCAFEYVGIWIAHGFRPYGVADSRKELDKLYKMAAWEVGV